MPRRVPETSPGSWGLLDQSEHPSGLHVLAARWAPGYDFIIVDAGSTLSTWTTPPLRMAAAVMLIATPDVACLRNLQRMADGVTTRRPCELPMQIETIARAIASWTDHGSEAAPRPTTPVTATDG